MYNLSYFKEQDPAVVLAFMRDHPFAFLSGVDHGDQPVATQVPVFIDEVDGQLFLSGHIMKNTDHHKAFLSNPNVLAVFTGANSYVSASWYAEPRQASTWNYMSVYAKGTIHFTGQTELLDILKRTTDHFEADPDSGANFKDIPSHYVEKLSNAIVAFRVEIRSVENVFKLSQNRDHWSYNNIISKLKLKGGDGNIIAREMERRESQLFTNINQLSP